MIRIPTSSRWIPLCVLLTPLFSAGQVFAEAPSSRGTETCPITIAAEPSQAVLGGGVTGADFFGQDLDINRHGVVTFFGDLLSDPSNQAILTSGPAGLQAIVRGCGSGGGEGSTGTCGDPSPLGGTFSGLFGGSLGPRINDAGDVLFFSDMVGGSSTRGLFVHRAATGSIETVVAVGDPSPLGNTIAEFGMGAIDSRGEVVFLARDLKVSGFKSQTYLARWRAGGLEKVAAAGDIAPDGSTFVEFSILAEEQVDGTAIPVLPRPFVDEKGTVVTLAESTGTGPGMLSVTRDGVMTWLVQEGDASPAGGTFLFPSSG
ncbi:MAG: hypothetical protein AAF725_08560, partial [Acidobacteriota bacterium]